MAEGDGFLSRWSRRKAGAKGGAGAADPAAPAAAAKAETPVPPSPASPSTAAPAATSAQAPPQPVPLPTLDDVAKLTRDSDFSPYVGRDVDAAVRNSAMKKLFSDPHFNVMDGLDTYIDDYGKADPIPLSMLRRMNQSAALGLFDKEIDPAVAEAPPPGLPAAQACPDGAGAAAVAESTPALPSLAPPSVPPLRADDDPDLQLQPDDADRRAGAGPGPRA
jgi:hypothetical protein